MEELEEGSQLKLDFQKIATIASGRHEVIPAVAQDIDTGLVLMLGYVNQEALDTALKKRLAVFWSTSRDTLWIKGASSGDQLELIEVRVNCEQNSLLYLVRPKGQGVCHTHDADGRSRPSCFYRVIDQGDLKQAACLPTWTRIS